MAELSSGVSWLESLGLAHGDIRPEPASRFGDHSKLADFDNTARIGDEVEVGPAPYVRLLGTEAGEDRVNFDFPLACTEVFAVESQPTFLLVHSCPSEMPIPAILQLMAIDIQGIIHI